MKKHANLAFFVPHNGCPQQCLFCNQNRISGADSTSTPQQVRAQCEAFLPAAGGGARPTEIAFFGGSFTAIDREIQRGLLEAAAPFVRCGRAAGIRLSTRPDAIDPETLDFLAAYGVTAIELGAQSMLDSVLAANRRGHTAADIARASALVRSHPARFELGLQMMVGMYGEQDPLAGALETARRLIALGPATARIYPTVVVENTPLCDLWREGKYRPLTVEQAALITARLLVLFEEAGVRVIRIGLHADESLRASTAVGPFHPAFGEIAQSILFFEKMQALLIPGEKELTVRVHPSRMSCAVGHGRRNLLAFARQGVTLRVLPDSTLPVGSVKRAEPADG